jgi:hypothetical protein
MAWSHVTGYRAQKPMEEESSSCSKRQETTNIEHKVETASLQAGRLRIDGDAFYLNPEIVMLVERST